MPAFRLLLFLPFIWVPPLAFGEGSVSWNEIENQLEMVPEIRAHLSKTLDIEEAGSGTRLGRHWGELHGARIGPYRFNAKPKGAAGGWQFALVVEVDITFLDAQGRSLKADPDPNDAVGIRESFVAAKLEPLEGNGRVAVGKVDLSEEDSKARSRWIRSRWEEISGRSHRTIKIEAKADGDPMAGTVERRLNPETGLVESIRVDFTTSDHGGFSEEYFYWNGKLFFVLREESHWSFDPSKEGRTIDFVSEERFYFTEGGNSVYRALSKKFQANSDQSLKKARDAASNMPFEYRMERPAELVDRSQRLLKAETEAAVLAIYTQD